MNYTGDKIGLLRKERKLSQEKLAELIGVSRQTIYKWEYGIVMPSEENIKALSVVFGVKPNCFYADKQVQDEIAVTEVVAVSNKKTSKVLIIFAVILSLLFVISLIVSTLIGLATMTPNSGFLAINSKKLNLQHFNVALVLTIILFVLDIVIFSVMILRKYSRKPNVNPM